MSRKYLKRIAGSLEREFLDEEDIEVVERVTGATCAPTLAERGPEVRTKSSIENVLRTSARACVERV